MIEPVRAAQHQVRAGEAGGKDGVLDERRAGFGRQPLDDLGGKPAVDAKPVAAVDVDPRMVGRGFRDPCRNRR